MSDKVFTVRYRTRVKHYENGYKHEEYKLIPDNVFCCERMKEYLRDRAVSFGEEPNSYEHPCPDCRTNRLHIFTADSSGFCDEGIEYMDYEIYFCPGCGARVEYAEVERIELVRQVVTETTEKIVYVEKKD